MIFDTIIEAERTLDHLGDPDWAVFDCRFSLQDPEFGRREYKGSHVPDSLYVHLDEDLSGKIQPGKTGRHPLPERAAFAEKLSLWGVDEQVQVVVYDDRGGALAARMWWMLHWLGHRKAAVLNGGWSHWVEKGYPVTDEVAPRPARQFPVRPELVQAVETSFVVNHLFDPEYRLVDARDRVRYLGKEEPIDPVAGHIPGAASAPFAGNLGPEGRFLPPAALRKRYRNVLQGSPPNQAVFYCGSGVTSAHDILAMREAGFPAPLLYPGSWSQWITERDRPRANPHQENEQTDSYSSGEEA